jgi:membrane associated rhomboid family serine protease
MLKFLPPATRAIIVANAIMYLIQELFDNAAVYRLALWPIQTPLFAPYQVITYAFLHGSLAHILLNMFAIYMFGRVLEELWGARRFLVFYFASVLAAGITQLIVTALSDGGSPTLGASGGVFGVLLAFAMYFPRQRIILLFPPIPMPAWVFVSLYAVAELVMGVAGTQQGVAHFAHLGGMLGGALVIAYWRATGQARRR